MIKAILAGISVIHADCVCVYVCVRVCVCACGVTWLWIIYHSLKLFTGWWHKLMRFNAASASALALSVVSIGASTINCQHRR